MPSQKWRQKPEWAEPTSPPVSVDRSRVRAERRTRSASPGCKSPMDGLHQPQLPSVTSEQKKFLLFYITDSYSESMSSTNVWCDLFQLSSVSSQFTWSLDTEPPFCVTSSAFFIQPTYREYILRTVCWCVRGREGLTHSDTVLFTPVIFSSHWIYAEHCSLHSFLIREDHTCDVSLGSCSYCSYCSSSAPKQYRLYFQWIYTLYIFLRIFPQLFHWSFL